MAYDDAGSFYWDEPPKKVDKPDWTKPDLLKRVVGNVLSQVVQIPATIPHLIGFGEHVAGKQDTWAQGVSKRANELVAGMTGVPADKRTLTDEALSMIGPASVVTAPLKLGGKVTSALTNFFVPTTVRGPGAAARAGLNVAIPTGVVAGVDTALGGDVVGRTVEEVKSLNPLTSAGAAPAQTPAVTPSTKIQTPLNATSGDEWIIHPPGVPAATPTKDEWIIHPPGTSATPSPIDNNASYSWDEIPTVKTEGTTQRFQDTMLGKMTIAAGVLLAGGKALSWASNKVAGGAKVGIASKLEGNILNKDAQITEAMEKSGVTPEKVEWINSTLHRTNVASSETRTRNMFMTGELDGFGKVTVDHRGGPQTMDGLFNEFSSMDEAVQVKLRRALNVGTEIDNRARVDSEGNSIKPILPESTADLTREYQTAMVDPDLRSFMDRFQQFNHQGREYAVKGDMLSRSDANDLGRANPHYMHYEWLGAMARREAHIGRDPDTMKLPELYGNSDPINGLAAWWTDMIREVGLNKAKKEVMNAIYRPNVGSPFVLRVDVKKPTTDIEKPLTVHWRDAGVDLYAVFHDAGLAAAVRNEPVLAGSVIKFMNGLRNLEQSATTGTIAAMAGIPFSINTAAMSGVMGSFSREKGTSMGMFDSMLVKATGGRFGIRMDPTWTVQALDAVVRDMVSQLTLYTARRLGRSVDSDGWMASVFGQQAVKQAQLNMLETFKETNLFVMRYKGAAHTGLHGVSDARLGGGLNQKQSMDYLRSVAPGVNTPMRAGIFKARTGLESVLELIGSSANSGYWRQNRGRMSDDVLASKTRKLSGDPAQIGSNKWVQGTSAVIPYLNTAIQGTTAMAKGALKHPGGAIGASMVTFGMLPYLYQAYLSSLPPEYADYYWNKMTPGDRASKVFPLFTKGTKPELAPSVQFPNELAPGVMAAMRYFGEWHGTTTGIKSPIAENLNQRLEIANENTNTDVLAGLTRFNPAGPPSWLRMIGSTQGWDLSGMQRFGTPTVRPIAGASLAGTKENPSNKIDSLVGAQMEHFLNQIPTIGAILHDAYHTAWTGEGLSGFWDRRKAAFADRVSALRPVWGVEQRLSAQTADSKRLDDRLDIVKEAMNQLQDRGNPLKKQDSGIPFVGNGPAPLDPPTHMAFTHIKNQYNALTREGGSIAKRNVEYNNLLRIENTSMSGEAKRLAKNEIVRKIDALTVDALNDVQRISGMLEALTGISLNKLDPGRNLNGTRFDGR